MVKETVSVVEAQKRSVAWLPFAQKLTVVLSHLEEDQFLVISIKRTNRFVQFAGQGSFGLRIETTSNSYLKKPERLKKKQITALVSAGWFAPTGKPKKSTPEKDPDGSPNYFSEFAEPVDYACVANLAVNTFVDILHIPHPGWLEYEAFDAEGNEILLKGLGLKQFQQPQPAPEHQDQTSIAYRLLETLRKATGIADLDFDSDGDIGVRCGSTVVFARFVDDPPVVHLFSPLLRDVEEHPGVVDQLNRLNAESRQLRYFYREGAVYGVVDIPAAPYVDKQVTKSFNHFCQIADDLGNLLQNEIGGHTMFQEWLPSVARH